MFALAFVATPNTTKETTDSIHWYTWEEMLIENAKNPKPIFVDVYTDWCGWCKKMDRSTFQDHKVVKMLSDDFYAVKLDAEQRAAIEFNNHTFEYVKNGRHGYHELAASLLDNQLSFPTTVILDAEYSRIILSPGFKDAVGMLNELEFAATGAYENESFQSFSQGR